MGLRFYRLLFFLFGSLLFFIAVLRLIQPAETSRAYLMIYGTRVRDTCCQMYLLSAERHTAHRVRLGFSEQTAALDSISPSQRWRLAHVRTGRQVEIYLLPLSDEVSDQPLRLDDALGRSWQYIQWSTQADQLYYLDWNGMGASLYQIAPDDPEPRKLTEPIFGYVRTMQEQPLPYTTYFPWVLIGLAINVLVIVAVVPYATGMKTWARP